MTLVAGIQLILKTTIGVFAADSHTQVKYLTDDRAKNKNSYEGAGGSNTRSGKQGT